MVFRKISIEEYNLLNSLIEKYKNELYAYNTLIKKYGFYLKPYHIVVKYSRDKKIKYIYYGRYWYRLKYIGKRGSTSKVKWVYIGSEKPINSLPDPPHNPLEGAVLKICDDGIYIKYLKNQVISL